MAVKLLASEAQVLNDGVRALNERGIFSADETTALLKRIVDISQEQTGVTPPLLFATEYRVLIEALAWQYQHQAIDQEAYHKLLKKVAEHRDLPEKPEVRIRNVTFSKLSDQGEIARGYALDHPRLGATDVRTSLVIVKGETYFETLNTRYVIVPDAVPAEDRSIPYSKQV